ncbi:succinate dehydrogenase assembly factor 1, mitochondrial [Sarcophilus harrisii]
MSRHSRLQRQVLGLYRELLRAARGTPGAEARVRAEFREQARLPRADVLRIEYLYRRGRRQLEQLRGRHTTGVGAFVPGAGSPETRPHADGPDACRGACAEAGPPR